MTSHPTHLSAAQQPFQHPTPPATFIAAERRFRRSTQSVERSQRYLLRNPIEADQRLALFKLRLVQGDWPRIAGPPERHPEHRAVTFANSLRRKLGALPKNPTAAAVWSLQDHQLNWFARFVNAMEVHVAWSPSPIDDD